MDFEARKQKALAIMASRKMWKSNYAPLLIRLLWRLGINIPPAAVCSVLAGFCRNDRLFLPWIWAVDVLDGVAGPGDASPVRLRNQSYRGRVIWPDDGTFSSVAAKGE